METETEFILKPEKVGEDSDWESISAGEEFSCAVKTNGKIYCFGSNEFEKIGDGSGANQNFPVEIVFEE